MPVVSGLTRSVDLAGIDLGLTVSVHRRGPHDPAFRRTADGSIWRCSHTPDGPGTLRISLDGRCTAWGPGAAWLLDGVEELVGLHDDPAALTPLHPVVAAAHARHAGLRIGRSRRVFEALVPAVLEQKVVTQEAWRAWGYLLRRFGTPAPGAPVELRMRVPPPPAGWARIPSWEWHRSGAEAVRARTIIGAARVASRLEQDASGERLRSLPGIGVWTAAEVRQKAVGDADALSVGDFHLPSLVGTALTGARTDDAGMLELLAPYAGQRYRASRLIELSGVRVERHGPRMAVRDYRRF